MNDRPETEREHRFRIIIGHYSTESKVAELNRVLAEVDRLRAELREARYGTAKAYEYGAWCARNTDGCEAAFQVSQELSDLGRKARKKADAEARRTGEAKP